MKRIVSIALIVLLFAACVVLSVRLHKQYAAYRLLNEGMEQLRNAHAALAVQETFRRDELSLNGSRMDMRSEISDVSGRTSELGKTIMDDVLVFYFSEAHCNLCVDAELKNLNKVTDSIGGKHIVILLHAMNERYFRKFMVEKNLTGPVYKMRERPAPLAGLERPCYFILEKASGRMVSVFMPQKEDVPATESYLEQTRNKYFMLTEQE
ncbi:MAG: hypothetical protein LBL33_01670 [Tannerella sp.]|jgi:hypothetical protein|nr:hypothetical protein [Tannerella sp.]